MEKELIEIKKLVAYLTQTNNAILSELKLTRRILENGNIRRD